MVDGDTCNGLYVYGVCARESISYVLFGVLEILLVGYYQCERHFILKLMLQVHGNMCDLLTGCYSCLQLFDGRSIMKIHDNMVKMFHDSYLRVGSEKCFQSAMVVMMIKCWSGGFSPPYLNFDVRRALLQVGEV